MADEEDMWGETEQHDQQSRVHYVTLNLRALASQPDTVCVPSKPLVGGVCAR